MRIIAVMLVMLSFAAPGAAGPLEDADAAMKETLTASLPCDLFVLEPSKATPTPSTISEYSTTRKHRIRAICGSA